jgi:hypothetical protein
LQRMSFTGDESARPSAGAIPTRSFSWLLLEKLPLFVLSAASVFITMAAARTDTEKIFYPRHIRIEAAIVSYVQYLKKAVWGRPTSRCSTLIPAIRCGHGTPT